jgi:hypothetical protein
VQIKGVCHAIVQCDARDLSDEYFLSGLTRWENMQPLASCSQAKENARWSPAGVSIENNAAWEEAAIALN